MVDLDELKRLAEDANGGYMEIDADTAKKLIAVALAAQKWNRAWAAFQATQIGNFTPDLIPACEAADEALRTALEELK